MLFSRSKPHGESLRLVGEIEFVLFNPDGSIADYRKLSNLIVNAGKASVAGLINGAAGAVFKYIAIGITNTAPAATDTALASEITTGGGARALATTITRTTTTVTNDTMQLVKTFTFSSGFTIVESGIFDQLAVGGVMLARQIFAGIIVIATQTLQVTWNVKVS